MSKTVDKKPSSGSRERQNGTKAVTVNLLGVCIMCQAPIQTIGLFIPRHPYLWPSRRVWYSLCMTCLLTVPAERVEQRLMELTSPTLN